MHSRATIFKEQKGHEWIKGFSISLIYMDIKKEGLTIKCWLCIAIYIKLHLSSPTAHTVLPHPLLSLPSSTQLAFTIFSPTILFSELVVNYIACIRTILTSLTTYLLTSHQPDDRRGLYNISKRMHTLIYGYFPFVAFTGRIKYQRTFLSLSFLI